MNSPELSVDGFQAINTLPVVVEVTRKFVGVVGGVRSRDVAETVDDGRNVEEVPIVKKTRQERNTNALMKTRLRVANALCTLRLLSLEPTNSDITQPPLFLKP